MSVQTLHYKYIGEGNAHVVLKIESTNYVLRLSKRLKEALNFDNFQLSINFVNKLMSPLFNLNLTHQYEVIEIPEIELTQIIHTIYEARPSYRKFQSAFNRYAVKAPNLLILTPDYDSYCIEIKPKEGFISTPFRKYSKCYYCLKQFLKFKDGRINTVSEYCPLDLFSGDKNRMKNALFNLINNPQNNFKLFKNNDMVYSENSNVKEFNDILNSIDTFKSTNIFLDFLTEMLLNGNKKTQIDLKETDPICIKGRNKCIETCYLSNDTFLHNLLYVQKLAENKNFSIKHQGIEYVNSILDQLKEASATQLSHNIDQFLLTLEPMHKALISAVAKDCSIMMTFSFGHIKDYPKIVIGDQIISYRVAVTDLEPKPVRTLEKRKITVEKLIKLFEEYLQSV